MQEQRKRRLPSRLQDAILLGSTGAGEVIASSEDKDYSFLSCSIHFS